MERTIELHSVDPEGGEPKPLGYGRARGISDGATGGGTFSGTTSVRRFDTEAQGGRWQSPNGRGVSVMVEAPEICGVVVGMVRRFNGC